MAKFRQSHHSTNRKPGYVIRGLFIVIFLVVLIVLGGQLIMNSPEEKQTSNANKLQNGKIEEHIIEERKYIPKFYKGSRIDHVHYSLGYDEDLEIAFWVAYELTKQSLQAPNVKRTNWYGEDLLVTTGSANYYDYKGYDYSRGHLVPAADMAFDTLAMRESFYMSNMAPQIRCFNGGVWNELEQNVRDWAYNRELLVVCTGPYFFDDKIERIGTNGVGVPHAFYKAILDPLKNESIAFLVSHEITDLSLYHFALSIDELEQELQMDFFSEYYKNNKDEDQCERHFDSSLWPIPDERYQKRVFYWNKGKY